jgi:hypothetical protein
MAVTSNPKDTMMTTDRSRRSHPASGARIIVTGISAAAALGGTGAFAVAEALTPPQVTVAALPATPAAAAVNIPGVDPPAVVPATVVPATMQPPATVPTSEEPVVLVVPTAPPTTRAPQTRVVVTQQTQTTPRARTSGSR